MTTYETKQDIDNATATAARLCALFKCESVEQPKFSNFDYLLRFDDGTIVCVEIKRRRGVLGEKPLDQTVWLSLHKRLAAQRASLPLWFVIACDNGDFVWHDKGESLRVEYTGRHGRAPEPVMQIPVASFIRLPTTR